MVKCQECGEEVGDALNVMSADLELNNQIMD